MKANELKVTDLMIGDWLKHYNGTPMQVTKITTEHFACAEKGGLNCWEYNNKYEPIPLTPEILKKNGILYEKQSYYYVIKDDKDLECTYYIQQILQEGWAIGVDIGAYDCSVFARIKYVHELQHALKLCGINKEIVV